MGRQLIVVTSLPAGCTCPIPFERQHVSDFGRIASFDMALVRIETDDGLVGWGEPRRPSAAPAAARALVVVHQRRARPGRSSVRTPGGSTSTWDRMYNGPRAGLRARRAAGPSRSLGRRGLTVSAMSGVDMALWDLLGQSLDVPVVELWGGPCRADMAAVRQRRLGRCRRRSAPSCGGYVDRGFACREDAGRRDGRRRRHQRGPGRRGPSGARPGRRPDGRCPRHVQCVRGASASQPASSHSPCVGSRSR